MVRANLIPNQMMKYDLKDTALLMLGFLQGSDDP
jgi:hypothetical protein